MGIASSIDAELEAASQAWYALKTWIRHGHVKVDESGKISNHV
jgi:hypothetical protein